MSITGASLVGVHRDGWVWFLFVNVAYVVGFLAAVLAEDASASHGVATAWSAFSLLHTFSVHVVLFLFFKSLSREKNQALETVSIWKLGWFVFVALSASIFFLQLATSGDAFYVTPDVTPLNTRGDRARFLTASLYSSVGILTAVGYGDVTPKQWYTRLLLLPNYLFTFLLCALCAAVLARALEEYVKVEHTRASAAHAQYYNRPAAAPMYAYRGQGR